MNQSACMQMNPYICALVIKKRIKSISIPFAICSFIPKKIFHSWLCHPLYFIKHSLLFPNDRMLNMLLFCFIYLLCLVFIRHASADPANSWLCNRKFATNWIKTFCGGNNILFLQFIYFWLNFVSVFRYQQNSTKQRTRDGDFHGWRGTKGKLTVTEGCWEHDKGQLRTWQRTIENMTKDSCIKRELDSIIGTEGDKRQYNGCYRGRMDGICKC